MLFSSVRLVSTNKTLMAEKRGGRGEREGGREGRRERGGMEGEMEGGKVRGREEERGGGREKY